MNPYLVLGVPLGADDAAIRRAYLEALKLAPPDHDPKRFQAISQAYEQIKDARCRHEYTLFHKTPPGQTPLDTFVQYLRLQSERRPLPFDFMKGFLRACKKV